MKRSVAIESKRQQTYPSHDRAGKISPVSQAFVDNRESTAKQRQLMVAMAGSPQAGAQRLISQQIHNSPRMLAQRNILSGISDQYMNKGLPVQRKILGESGIISTLDPAKKHKNFDFSLGFTPPTINFTQISQASDVVNAFKGEPQLIDVRETEKDNFTAVVNTVPTNYAGYKMYLPMPGPWITIAKKSEILSLLNVADNGRNLTDKIELEITGPKGHEMLAQQVKTHEMVHAKDNEEVRDQILKPWDDKLTQMEKDKRVFHGATAVEASDKLWAAAGGSLNEVAAEVNRLWGKHSDDFHQHKTGKTRLDNKSTKVNDQQTRATFSYYLTI